MSSICSGVSTSSGVSTGFNALPKSSNIFSKFLKKSSLDVTPAVVSPPDVVAGAEATAPDAVSPVLSP